MDVIIRLFGVCLLLVLFVCCLLFVYCCLFLAEVDLWDEFDVKEWLEGIGMGEYTASFIQHGAVGTRLQQLKKSDLQV